MSNCNSCPPVSIKSYEEAISGAKTFSFGFTTKSICLVNNSMTDILNFRLLPTDSYCTVLPKHSVTLEIQTNSLELFASNTVNVFLGVTG